MAKTKTTKKKAVEAKIETAQDALNQVREELEKTIKNLEDRAQKVGEKFRPAGKRILSVSRDIKRSMRRLGG